MGGGGGEQQEMGNFPIRFCHLVSSNEVTLD